MHDKPLVDSGMIQVALALTAVGFFLTGSPNSTVGLVPTREVGQRIFTGSGLVAATLIGSYVSDWLSTLPELEEMPIGRRVHMLIIMVAYLVLFFTVALSVLALSSFLSPTMRALVQSFFTSLLSSPLVIFFLIVGCFAIFGPRPTRKH